MTALAVLKPLRVNTATASSYAQDSYVFLHLALLSKQFYIVLLTAMCISSCSDLQESRTESKELKMNVVKF